MQIKAFIKNSFERRMLDEKKVRHVVKFNENFNTWHQRLVLGIASISSQPFFDYYNKNVDQETRHYSAVRTAAKIIVGTTEGCLVRFLAIKYGKKIAFKWLNKDNSAVVKELKKFFEMRRTYFQNKVDLNDNNRNVYESSAKRFKGYSDKLDNWIGAVRKHVKQGGSFDAFKFEGEKTKDLDRFLKESGNVISVGSAFIAGLLIDIPMTNKVLSWGMDLLFPEYRHKTNGGSK
ncbi:MAG: hypothetical protein PHC34_01780 [Candidatus Gastranaerophilales bacterium]|nr:hypothetical protein [Candidatus Gastranaerophilales bacterium]